jgi:Holliday junction resolvase RusA-like endonuclease
VKIEFSVLGVPAPQGSKRGIVNKYTNRVAMIESSKKVKPWRDDVARAAEDAMMRGAIFTDAFPLKRPLTVTVTFMFLRPAAHINTKGGLRPSAPVHLSKRPDLDKLLRSTFDALTSRLWVDDAQIVHVVARKKFGETSGAHIVVEEL